VSEEDAAEAWCGMGLNGQRTMGWHSSGQQGTHARRRGIRSGRGVIEVDVRGFRSGAVWTQGSTVQAGSMGSGARDADAVLGEGAVW
jgi:hypothetical protein